MKIELKMRNIYAITYSIALLSILISCKGVYQRQEGCHLDKMAIFGDVVKVETIVQSTMPLTELYANAFDPKSVLSSYVGNVTINFDNNGNVNHSVGYGIDGQILFTESKLIPEDEGNMSPAIPIGPGANQKIDRIKTVSSKDGKIVNVKYYDGNNLIWNQKANYNDDGTIRSIIKEYESLKIKTDYYTLSYADTTIFNYLSYDFMNNWTEAEISYKGILPKHAHSYKLKRQLTYVDEEEKLELIRKLKDYNDGVRQTTHMVDEISLCNYGRLSIPHYMAIQSKKEIGYVQDHLANNYGVKMNYLFMSVYDKKDAYATFSVSLTYGEDTVGFDDLSPEELKYDEETDKFLEEQNTLLMAQGGTYILKWLPYEFVTISGKKALKYRYYRYGNGSPIPVYCENYTIPMGDGNTINIIYSFQSNLDYKFRSDFNNAIKSIKFM